MAVAERPLTSVTEKIEVTNPVTGAVIGAIHKSTREEVQNAVERARNAQQGWTAMSVKERGVLIRRWGDLLWEDQRNAMKIIRDESGKNDTGAYAEIIFIDNYVNYYAQHAPRLLKPQRRPPAFPLIQWAKVYYKPWGVVGMITPWNYPLGLSLCDAIPALIAGNAVVFKPSEITPFSTLYAIDLMHKAGIPHDVVQVVTGDGSTGAALVDLVDYVGFTGSTAVGRKVAVNAAERLIPYSLELGGKDAMIVLQDANVDLAASGVFIGGTENAGQMCISVERVYVEDPIYDRFVERVRHFAGQVNIGSGDGYDVHVGSLTNEREMLRVERHIQDAIDKGAQLLSGGKRRPDLGPLFFEPAVLVNVDHSMDVMREETFGPIIPIMKVKNADEAIRMANDSEYGLSGSIFTRDLKRGEQLATRIDTGDIGVNRAAAVAASPKLPWGGQKNSGVGRRGGPEGLLRFVSTQSVLVDRQIGTKPALALLDPLTLNFLKLMRTIRRVLPFA